MSKCAQRAAFRFFLMALFLWVACAGAFAQANSALTGIVTDQTGAVIDGASITVTDPATGATRSTVSSSTGLYLLPGLNAADYNLKVSAKGFQTYEQTGVVVNVSSTVRVDVKMVIGAESTTVTVQADALTVQADSNVVSTLISEQQITELATNGRNVVALATLGLGVSGDLPDMNMPTSVGSSFRLSFNGLNQAHNIWLIDGGEAYDRGSGGKSSMMPSQDALSEFQVLTSNYPPDYGISSGGTVSMSLKSGTQAFHGEAWEFLRNDALQGHNYFDQPGKKKPELRMNVFGANVGGPVILPGYNADRKKTFFFVNEEWRRIIQGSAPAGIHAVPAGDLVTSAQDFTYKLPAYAPASQKQVFVPTVSPNSRLGQAITAAGLTMGQPFPNNTIPGTLLDPSALAFNKVGAIPAANVAGDLISVSTKQPTYVREDLVRIDHNINEKWQLFGHYIHDSVSQTYALSMWSGDSYPTVGSDFSNPSNSSVIKLTGAITPNVLLEAAFNWNGNTINIMPVGTAYQKPAGWGAQTYFPPSNNAKNRLPSINLTSWGTQFDPWSQPWHNAAQDEAETVALSWTNGKHAMKFGGGYNRYTKNQQIFGNTNGFYTFTDGWDSANLQPSGVLTGDSYLDFLLGASTNYAQLQEQDIRHYVNQTLSAFAMDNWHVSPRLSLQFGFRYDALPHAWERNNLLASFDPTTYQSALAPTFDPNTATFCTAVSATCPVVSAGLRSYKGAMFYLNGVTIAGQGATPRGMVRNDYNTFQPRVGFSYDLVGNGKTVLRGGFGTFFERIQGNDIYNIAPAAPFSNNPGLGNVSFDNPYANWQSGVTLSNATLPVAARGMTTMAPRYPAPGVAQFSLGVQRELVPSTVLVTQYVGNISWHQSVQLPINPFPLATPLSIRKAFANGTLTKGAGNAANALLQRTYPGFADITEQTNIATGTYNALQIGLRQQNRHGLSYEVNYTYSHQIDSQPDSNDMNNNPVSNPFNLRYDRGSGLLDRRHMLNINYVYDLPFFANTSGMVKTMLGGWTLSGTVVSQTGLPWAGNGGGAPPGYGGPDTVGLGTNYRIRADFSGKVQYPKTRNANGVYQYVSSQGFTPPVAAWDGGPNLGFGNAGKDIIVGPGNTNFNINLYKAFQITERTHFEFRAESFNSFNHTQFTNFRNNLSGGDFGQASAVHDPRTFELGGKFVF